MKDLYKKKTKIKKDLERRILFKKQESSNIIYTILTDINFLTPKDAKYNERYINDKITIIRNHCILSGNRHSVYRRYRLHRSFFRQEILNGNMPGFRKSIW